MHPSLSMTCMCVSVLPIRSFGVSCFEAVHFNFPCLQKHPRRFLHSMFLSSWRCRGFDVWRQPFVGLSKCLWTSRIIVWAATHSPLSAATCCPNMKKASMTPVSERPAVAEKLTSEAASENEDSTVKGPTLLVSQCCCRQNHCWCPSGHKGRCICKRHFCSCPCFIWTKHDALSKLWLWV